MSKSLSYVGNYSDSGSRNAFYTIKRSRYGFKTFPTKELAEFAHSVQNSLSTKDLAPRVYSPVGKIRVPNYFVKNINGNMESVEQMVLSDWGYMTEIAKTYYCPSGYECDDHCGYTDECENYTKIKDLLFEIDKMGIEYTDCHNGNLGYVTRNKKRVLVVIDVGRESIGDYDDSLYPYADIYDMYDEEYDHCSCSACRGES